MGLDWKALEEKWQRRWTETGVFEAEPGKGSKFFVTIAFPYPNMPFHVGHGRPYTFTDVYARYMRMRGRRVLFPMAFHYTGTPILAIAKRVAAGDPSLIDDLSKVYKVPTEEIRRFVEPLNIANYFRRDQEDAMKAMGYSIDWRREFTTIDPPFSRYVGWQFRKLRAKGLIKQGSHPVGWCPNDNNPMGQHDTKGDVEPEIGEMTLIKFKAGDIVLPTGTLRPETIYGVTNIWVRPDVDYILAEVDGQDWIVSQECARKLPLLGRRINVKEKVPGRTLIGRYAINPATGRRLPILPASFVDPGNATGVVMSVPAHAPFDWAALEELKKAPRLLAPFGVEPETLREVEPISVVALNGHSEFPALDVLRHVGAEGQMDERVEAATKEIYSEEFHLGIMRQNTGEYAGLKVSEARTLIEKDLIDQSKAERIYELLNRPVYCRCGTEVVVKVLENQWFINYGDAEWKSLAHQCIDGMRIVPEDLRAEFNNVVDWLQEKACARQQGLGTRLPWDPAWVIEALSDSTIYMTYYIIAKYVNSKRVSEENLVDPVFDYVLLGEGDVQEVVRESGLSPEVLDDMRGEFLCFYPMDSRNSGRDLVPNHLTYFVFNHVALFPRKLWPEQIAVTGSVLMEGKKMSKSLGNIIPLTDAIRDYGVDPFRLSILSTAELQQDADFVPALTKALGERLERLHDSALEVAKKGVEAVETTNVDRWMLSRLQHYVSAVTKAMDGLRFREAIQNAVYLLDQDVQWYVRRKESEGTEVGSSSAVLREVLMARVLFLAPFTPHLCEEIWEAMGKEGFVSTADWPVSDDSKVDTKVLSGEELVASVREDTLSILAATKLAPKKVVFYVAAPWKWRIYLNALTMARDSQLQMSRLMRLTMGDAELRKDAKRVSSFVQELVEDLVKAPRELVEGRLSAGRSDEFQTISEARIFLAKELKADVLVYHEDDESRYDPRSRARLAEPYRPAIYVE